MMPYKLMVKARALVLNDDDTFASFEDFIKHLTSKDETNKKLWVTVLSMYELGILRDCTETEERLVAKYNESIVNIFENVATN